MKNSVKEIPQSLIDAYTGNVIPMHVVNDYLKHHKKPTARSWDELFAKNSTEVEFFNSLLTEITCFGRKTIFAYNAEEIDINPLNALELKDMDITNAFNHAPAQHILFRRSIGERFSSYTFLCKKPANEIYVLTQADLSNDAREKFWSPQSEIKLKTNVMVPVFESIIYDAQTKVLFVVIDNLRYSFEQSDFEKQIELVNIVSQICPSFKTIELIDFFPCIDEMYIKASEGIVHKLAFECNTGAVRDERLRQGQLDLRDEKYHTNGKAAIGGVIRPYKLGITWHPSKYKELGSEIDFEINGSRKDLHKNSGVYSCQVRSSVAFEELCFALNRVILYASFD